MRCLSLCSEIATPSRNVSPHVLVSLTLNDSSRYKSQTMAKKKNSPDLFNEPVINKSQDFADLFENSISSLNKTLRVGDSLKAEILSIGKSEAFVSTGTPLDAVLFNADLLDENKNLKYKVGDIIDVVVVRANNNEIRVTRKGSKSAPVDFDSLEDAFDMELPVEGKVTEAVNGGYRVSVQGQSAFCPISQLGVPFGQDATEYIGKKFEFLITQFDGRKKNIVVSRRKLLSLQKAESEGVWIESNKVGDIVTGKVTRVEQFGAFVDLGGGVEGLVHVSEVGFVRLKHANEGVRLGDNVQVKILKIEEEDNRLKIALSMKQAGELVDPWYQVPQQFPVGAIVDGTVDKKENYGLFVVIIPGINGLLPKSKWRDSENAKNYEQLKKGDAVKVRVDEIKFEERKISLGLPTEAEDNSWREHQSGQSMGGLSGSLAAAFAKAQGDVKSKR
jgi:small subunit ribosomal protein S1